jgi:hypothetical protein
MRNCDARVLGNQGGVWAECFTCRKVLLQGDHELKDYRKAVAEHKNNGQEPNG